MHPLNSKTKQKQTNKQKFLNDKPDFYLAYMIIVPLTSVVLFCFRCVKGLDQLS